MPSAIPRTIPLPKWQRPAKTTYDLPWADLSVIDLSAFDAPGGKEKLAKQLEAAVHNDGFFSVINTGFTEEEITRQFSIAEDFFQQPREQIDKPEVRCNFAEGNYFGYRRNGEKKLFGTDIYDNAESINIPKSTPAMAHEIHHPLLKPFDEEIEDFQRKSFEVVRKIFILFASILELPEDYFVSRHLFEDKSEDHLRYMIYHPRTIDEDAKVANTWSRSHTDFGSLTLLWSQNVAGLQIKTSAGDWKYVRPVDSGIICNVGDTLSFWSAGYFKSTIHRVVRPPPDQCDGMRLGLFYFVRPGDDVDLVPAASPLIRKMGLVKEGEANSKPVKGFEYVRARVKSYHEGNYDDKTGAKFKVGNLEVEDQIA